MSRVQQVNIQFTSADQVQSFINMIDKWEVDFRLGSECRAVNAKSILGVLSLDLSQPQALYYNSADYELYEMLKPFFA